MSILRPTTAPPVRRRVQSPPVSMLCLLLLLLQSWEFAESQRLSPPPTVMPQFSQIATGAPSAGKSIAERLADEETTTAAAAAPSAIITTHATMIPWNGTVVTEQPPSQPTASTDSTSSVFITGHISTVREEYQRDRPMESVGSSVSRGSGGLLFDPSGGMMSRDGPVDVEGHSYHVPAKCHTYIPDHLAGDDDYRKCVGLCGAFH